MTEKINLKIFKFFRSRIFISRGFTLLEILIVMAILSGLIFVISYFGYNVFNLQIFLGQSFVEQQEVSLTLSNMGIEMRGMGPSANGSYTIESASSKSFTFYSDVDGSGVFSRVRYYVSGTTLTRGLTKPTGNPAVYNPANEVLTDVVHNVILAPVASQSLFTYYDPNYTGTQTAMPSPINVNQIRLVKITVTVDPTPGDTKSRTDYSNTVLIRNLRNVQ